MTQPNLIALPFEAPMPSIVEEIYREYPRKIARPAAHKAILKALRKHDGEFLKNKTGLFAAVWKGATKEDLVYCPHPATWFNQERFNDDPATWNGPKRSGPSVGTLRLKAGILKERIDKLENDLQYDDARMGPGGREKAQELKALRTQYKAVQDQILAL